MGGWSGEFNSNSTTEERTIVLVGRTGNGKSATANNILGKRVFDSRACTRGVTTTTEMHSARVNQKQVINVIDTVGLFDSCLESDVIGNEIVKCIGLAKDGIHAILLVFTVRARFTEEESSTLQILLTLFGPEIINYVVVVFTGGDELEEDKITYDDYLIHNCPESLKHILNVCKGRHVVFDNKTKLGVVKAKQRQNLFDLMDVIMRENRGQPYTDNILKELRKGAMVKYDMQEGDPAKQQIILREDQIQAISNEVAEKLRETTAMFEKMLANEQAARLRAEEKAVIDHEKSRAEIDILRENLALARPTKRPINIPVNIHCGLL